MLRHVLTKPLGARGWVPLLSLVPLIWAAWAGPAAGSEAQSPADRASGSYRQLILEPGEGPEPTRLLPAGQFGRHAAGRPKSGPLIRSNWRKLTIPAASDGHFYVTARVKKKPPSYRLVDITFLVDTGASLVALTRKDAQALGFEERDLEFSGISQTANGEVKFAAVTLPELRVGSFKVKDLSASVVAGELEISLLGNSFLSQLKSYQVSNDELVLRW